MKIKNIEKQQATIQNMMACKENYLLNEIKNILVVNELNITPINFFFGVLFLFHLKDMLQEVEIQS